MLTASIYVSDDDLHPAYSVPSIESKILSIRENSQHVSQSESLLLICMAPTYNYYQAISSKDAAALDKDLMDVGGFSLDQLMELAGVSVSQAGTYCGGRECH